MRINKVGLSMVLPNVGDKLTKVMSRGSFAQAEFMIPEACEVTYVNTAHNWYEVRFINSGLRECYSLPDFNHDILTNLPGWANPVLCVETGHVYRSVSDCAKDMGLFAGSISHCVTGEWDSYNGYHFDSVL